MKNAILLFALLITPMYLFSVTVTWNGASGVDNDWNTSANWDLGIVPGPADDAIIPNGFVVDLDAPGGQVATLDIQGTSTFNMVVGFSFSTTFTIAAGATVNWAGTLSGGGILTNNGTINIGTSIATLGLGGTTTTLNNEGTINLLDIGDIFIFTGNVLNNNSMGTIEFHSNFSGISRSNVGPHVFNNAGMLIVDPPNNTDSVSINVELRNNNGTIQVEEGTLQLNNNVNLDQFNDGTYNVFPGTTLNITTNSTMSGTLGGTVEGVLNIPSFVTVAGTATLDFGLAGGVVNFDPTINGGGTLINSTTLTISSQNVNIQDAGTDFRNEDLILFTAAGDIFIGTDAQLTNAPNGTIEFTGDTGNIQSSGASPNTFVNFGGINANFSGDGSDFAQISADMESNNGIISVTNGTIFFFEENIVLNSGIYNIAADGHMEFDLPVTVSGSLLGNIQGEMNWNNKINVTGAASFDFGGTRTVNFNGGNLDGGGVLTNNSIINVGSNFNWFIYGASTLNNEDTINFISQADILIATDGVLNNNALGDINFLADGAGFGINSSPPRTFNNFGDIVVNLPDPADDVSILCEFNNNNGNIQIEQGALRLNNTAVGSQNLFDGVYNVFADGSFDWENDLTISGEMTGQVDGPIKWEDELTVAAATTATFNFLGSSSVIWSPGSLNGGGTLINSFNIDLTNNGSVFINDGSTLENRGNLTLTTLGDLGVQTNGAIDNTVSGVIELQQPAANIFNSGAAPQTLNNAGTLLANTGGVNAISIDVNNSGLIDIVSGELEFNTTRTLHNQVGGIIKGNGTLDLPDPANFTNDGVIAPGLSPGTLTIIGDYSSTSNAILEIEIDGLVQGTEFDYIPITNTTTTNVIFDGTVDVTMGFDADISDEFVISTLSGNGIISACNLQSPVFADFGGMTYEFSVICRNDNEVVLTVVNETLSVDSIELSESLILYPNPVEDIFTLKKTSSIQLVDAEITDLRGSVIHAIELDEMAEQQTFDISGLSSGIYFIKINSELGSTVKRLIKK